MEFQPYFDSRPAMTKYSYFPIVDPRKQIQVPVKILPTYNYEKVFNPGNTTSPWSGFATNINKESELRNQVFALQKCSQSVYVPNSNSDLYQYTFYPNSTVKMTHNLLFEKNIPPSIITPPEKPLFHEQMFLNSTRTQINKEI
jgi:hypothetical protein